MRIPYKEYARRVGKKPSDIHKLIEEKRIAGVRKDHLVGYMVPENALINHKIRAKQERTLADHSFNLIQALNKNRNVNARILQMQETQYESLIATLVDANLVRRDRAPKVYDSGLALTYKGIELAGYKKRVFLEMYKHTVAGVTEGLARTSLL